MSETSKTAKIIFVLYWGLGYKRSHIRSMAQYSTKMIFAVLDVSLIMDLNVGETDKKSFFELIQLVMIVSQRIGSRTVNSVSAIGLNACNHNR